MLCVTGSRPMDSPLLKRKRADSPTGGESPESGTSSICSSDSQSSQHKEETCSKCVYIYVTPTFASAVCVCVCVLQDWLHIMLHSSQSGRQGCRVSLSLRS